MQAASARLRRTFAYPTDSSPGTTPPHGWGSDDDSSNAAAAALDEQEQEDLIAALAAQNAARDAQFRLFLLLLPACSALPYLLAIFRAVTTTTSSA